MNAPVARRCASRILLALAVVAGTGALSPVASAAPAKPAPVKWETYAGNGFTLTLPEGYTANPQFEYDQLGGGRNIPGTSFTIPERISTGSNLSADTYLSVERLPAGGGPCTASRFLPEGATIQSTTEKGVAYSVGTFEDAGAGNRYDESVYVLVKSRPCTAVRYFVHSTNIGNYDPGSVTAFNEPALIAQFDKIRRSLRLK
jgi:hypothetical protein